MPLRLLFANVGYPPFVGGAQTYVRLLAQSLAADGHQVTVFTTDAGEVESLWNASKPRLAAGEERVEQVMVRRVPLRHPRPSPYAYYLLRRLTVALAQVPGLPPALLGKLAHFTPWVPDFSRSLAQTQEPVDLVHGFAIPFESILQAAAGYAQRLGVPYVLTPFLHTGAQDEAVARGYAMPHQIRLLQGAAAVVTLSERERAFLVRRGLAPSRVYTIPAGIPHPDACSPTAASSSRPSRPSVLFLGAVTYEKGAFHLTDALRRLWAEGRAIDLIFAGTVTDQFRRYYRALSAEDQARIQLLGIVQEGQKNALLRDCTLLALPSRVDSFGLVYLEAWAHGKPVIGARAGGVPEVIDDGENGLLAPFGDVEALASTIRRLVDDVEEAARLGLAGRRKLEARYTWDRVYTEMLNLYQRVLNP